MRFLLLGAAIVGIAVLAGCATLSRAECEAGDWRALGMSDGANGQPLSHFDNHVSACAEHGIRIDRAVYEAGRNDGLRTYCRLDRAEREGREGRTYHNVCSGDLGVSFARVHLDARAIADLDRQVTSTRRELDALINRLTTPDLSETELMAIRMEIRTVQSALDRLERERSAAERQLAATRRQEETRLAGLNIAY